MDKDARNDAREQADAPGDNGQPMSGDDAETVDKAMQDETDSDSASASASDADSGDLSDAGDTE